MPKGKKITAVRADSATHQAASFNWCERKGTAFTIGADQDAAATMAWYCQRGDASENRIKELKIGFGMEYTPSR